MTDQPDIAPAEQTGEPQEFDMLAYINSIVGRYAAAHQEFSEKNPNLPLANPKSHGEALDREFRLALIGILQTIAYSLSDLRVFVGQSVQHEHADDKA